MMTGGWFINVYYILLHSMVSLGKWSKHVYPRLVLFVFAMVLCWSLTAIILSHQVSLRTSKTAVCLSSKNLPELAFLQVPLSATPGKSSKGGSYSYSSYNNYYWGSRGCVEQLDSAGIFWLWIYHDDLRVSSKCSQFYLRWWFAKSVRERRCREIHPINCIL